MRKGTGQVHDGMRGRVQPREPGLQDRVMPIACQTLREERRSR